MVRVCLVSFKKLPKCPAKWLYHLAISPATNESFCGSTSFPAFGVVSVLHSGHSNRCVLVFYCFTLQFLDDLWCGRFFFFAIWISSLVRCLLKALAHFLIEFFVSLLLSRKSSLHILENCPLWDVSFANILVLFIR